MTRDKIEELAGDLRALAEMLPLTQRLAALAVISRVRAILLDLAEDVQRLKAGGGPRT